jgi:hypothetical protein
LKFIADKIGDEGKLTFAATVTDSAQPDTSAWTNRFEVELSEAAFDAQACRITYHWRSSVNGRIADDKDYSLDLREVSKIIVLPASENQRQVDSRNGHDSWQSTITPQLFVVVTKRPKNVENTLVFSDEDMAHRVAKAITHAVELCGGGQSEPS